LAGKSTQKDIDEDLFCRMLQPVRKFKFIKVRLKKKCIVQNKGVLYTSLKWTSFISNISAYLEINPSQCEVTIVDVFY
jgi:hypothetical protein